MPLGKEAGSQAKAGQEDSIPGLAPESKTCLGAAEGGLERGGRALPRRSGQWAGQHPSGSVLQAWAREVQASGPGGLLAWACWPLPAGSEAVAVPGGSGRKRALRWPCCH